MKRTRIMFIVASVLLVMTGLGTWLYFHLNDLTIVRVAPLQVTVPKEPATKGRLYALGPDTYLLVLTNPLFDRAEGYWVNLRDREVGRPDFSYYRQFLGYAIVSERTFWGFPSIGELAADWTTDDGEIHMRITSRAVQAQKADPVDDVEGVLQKSIPLAYKKDIVIRK